MRKGHLVIIIILIFIISVAVRYWPIFHKGFSYGFSIDNLILARNLSLTNEYKIDNEKNVILSSEIVKEQGIHSKTGNKLIPILYGKIFDVFGFNQNFPLYVCLVLYGFVSILLFLLVLKLFDIWVALLFSFLEIFSPLVIQQAIIPGSYEWGVLFLAIALLFYLWKEKPDLFRLFLAGLFFALASLARNSFLILPFAFLVYDFWKNKSFKRIIIFILPIIIVWFVYLGLPLIKEGVIENHYLSSQETTRDFMHIFPDPYTWHFERDAYAKTIQGTTNYDYTEFLSKYGYPVSLKNKILMYWASIKSYPKGLFDQTIIGGPFMVFFLILGGFYLFRKKKELLQLFILWIGILYFFLIITGSNNWGFFMALQFPIFLLISLGIYWIFQFILHLSNGDLRSLNSIDGKGAGFVLKQNFKNCFKYLLISGFAFVLFLHLIQSDKWMFHQNYLYSDTEKILSLVNSIEEKKGEIDKEKDIIAVGTYDHGPAMINYYTDFSCVYFKATTIKKLLKENKLQWAFDQFGVTKVVGYDEDLTKEIIENTNAINMASTPD